MSSSPSLAGSELVQKTVNILDSVNWAAQGNHKAADYESYIQGNHADEIGLMDGLLGEFLQKVLGFNLLNDLQQQQTQKTTGGRPDYIPDDTHLHPFVFDAKGSDTANLDSHFQQIKGYIVAQGVPYGVLSNMRELAVYAASQKKDNSIASQARVTEFCFRFDQLYDDYKSDTSGATALGTQNGKRFLRFVERFSRRELDEDGKVQAIMDARHGSHDATLDAEGLDDLVRRLHEIVDTLHDDAKRHRQTFPKALGVDFRRERVALEIDVIAREINRDLPERNIDAEILDTLVQAPDGTPDAQALDRYFYRVAYFSATRIMLARVWEDTNLIDQTLYDGGFKKWYEVLGRKISRVLSQAFLFAKERYSWLYGIENNYTWYTPSETTLVDVLYDFSRFDLSRLDADVLGAVYEAYLDETDRKNKGQYYTPRSMVSFIWDRVGFTSAVPTSVFRFEAGERKERVVLDFCTGSGGFLVEAARRIRETALGASFDHDEPNSIESVSTDDLELAIRAILNGLRGSELSPFAYYLTEVNLLIQLTPVVAALQRKMQKVPEALTGQNSTLSVIHQDALKLHNSDENTISGLSEEHKRSDEFYEQDKRHDIVALDEYKSEVYDHIKTERNVDYACSNPPYVGEKSHKDLFRYVRGSIPYWKQYYQGKMDYLYWFLILSLSKLREGGRLGYITTNYWPTADGAAKLRRYILKHAKIIEVIDFGNTRIFSDALGQHDMVVVLERSNDVKTRDENTPLVVKVKREFNGASVAQKLEKLLDHVQEHMDAVLGGSEDYEDEYVSVFVSPVTQGTLGDEPWSLYIRRETATILDSMERKGTPLGETFDIKSGADITASRVTRRHLRLLPSGTQARIGDGIFVLAEEERRSYSWHDKDAAYVKPFFKNSDIGRYCVDRTAQEDRHLLYVDWATKLKTSSGVYKHLSAYRSVLQDQIDRFGEDYQWYQLHRPRERRMFEGEKIVAPQRAATNVFGYSNEPLYSSRDVYYILTPEVTDDASGEAAPQVIESLKYVCGVLNSKLVLLWLLNKGKRKGKALELYSTPLGKIPLRRIRFPQAVGNIPSEKTTSILRDYLENKDYETVYARLNEALNVGSEGVVHDGIVTCVEKIIDSKTDLVPYNRYFDKLLTRLEEGEPLPGLLPLVVLDGLNTSEKWNIDMHITNGTLRVTENFAKASLTSRDDFYFYRIGKKKQTTVLCCKPRVGRKPTLLLLKGMRTSSATSTLLSRLGKAISGRRLRTRPYRGTYKCTNRRSRASTILSRQFTKT